jgi:hypothetical protein
MKPELSIIIPSIRSERLEKLYESILASTTRTFEIVIVGPYPLPPSLSKVKNIKYAKDFGSPVRASNIAASLCEGKVYTWAADDCLFFKDSLDIYMNEFYEMGDNKKNVLVGKYYEGEDGSKERATLQPESYFKICNTPASSPHLPADWWLFNIGFMYSQFFHDLGGWDCSFQGTWSSHADMAIRAQFLGANVKLASIPLFECDHMPGGTGDHMPIILCQHQFDEPLLHKKYRNENWPLNNKMKLSLDNWKESETIWKRRFHE